MSGDNLPKYSVSSSSSTSIVAANLYTTNLSATTASSSSNNNTNKFTLFSPLSNAIISSASTSSSSSSSSGSSRYVKLNVGGRLFATSLDTLTKQDNMLRAMFSTRMELTTDSDGYVLIDRCGKHFELILNYLRDEDAQYANISLDDKSELELYEILKEAKFYCIQPLVAHIEQKILSNKSLSLLEPYLGSSIVSMVTSKHELFKILSSTDKPCIRLLINRHNNKYSYTNTSDDNLLKNIELFERMSIKFKNRIVFIKDTLSNEEICCWYFHGGGKKLAEVCCTSIVYTTEKKQTKVEFPDSKILEEIFVNAVLFESKDAASKEEQQLANGAVGGLDDETDDIVPMMPRISLGSQSNGTNLIIAPSTAAATTAAAINSSAASNNCIGQQIAQSAAICSAAAASSSSSSSSSSNQIVSTGLSNSNNNNNIANSSASINNLILSTNNNGNNSNSGTNLNGSTNGNNTSTASGGRRSLR